MAHAHPRRARGRLRDRERRRRARGRPAAPRRRDLRLSSAPRAEPKRVLRRDGGVARVPAPLAWSAIAPDEFDGLILPGGHAPGHAPVPRLVRFCRRRSARFWRTRPARRRHLPRRARARARQRSGDGQERARTARAPPACRSTWSARAYLATAWKLGRYYRTYPAYVEDEVRAALGDPGAVRARAARRHEARHRHRRRRRLRRRGRPLRLGALARRRVPIRAPLRRSFVTTSRLPSGRRRSARSSRWRVASSGARRIDDGCTVATRARASGDRHVAPARLRDPERAAEQRLRRGRAEADDDVAA